MIWSLIIFHFMVLNNEAVALGFGVICADASEVRNVFYVNI